MRPFIDKLRGLLKHDVYGKQEIAKKTTLPVFPAICYVCRLFSAVFNVKEGFTVIKNVNKKCVLLCCCKVLAIVCFKARFLSSRFEVKQLSDNYFIWSYQEKNEKNESVESFVLFFVLNHVAKSQQIKLFCALMMLAKVGRFEKGAHLPFPVNVMIKL